MKKEDDFLKNNYSSKSIKKVKYESEVSAKTVFNIENIQKKHDKLKKNKHVVCYQKLYETFRYKLIDFGRLTMAAKMCAHKRNLDNITKSGLK